MIQLAVPNLTGKEAEYVQNAIASNHLGPAGRFVERFEAMVAEAANRKWAVATITGTAALHVAAIVLGFSGKRVSVPADCFPAARNMFSVLGCEIAEYDGGHNHDYAGYVPGGNEQEINWPLLADRAPAIGEGKSGATVECYSFAANKIVTCGHGGAIVGDDATLEHRIRQAIHPGRARVGKFNYRMANINAAIGCAQMERLAELKEAKRRIWKRYAEHLLMVERGQSRWMATADIALPKNEVPFEIRYEARGTSLPCSTNLTEADQDKVIKTCVAYL